MSSPTNPVTNLPKFIVRSRFLALPVIHVPSLLRLILQKLCLRIRCLHLCRRCSDQSRHCPPRPNLQLRLNQSQRVRPSAALPCLLGVLISGCGLVPIEQPLPSAEITNPFDFDAASIRGGVDGWEEAIIGRQQSGGYVDIIGSGESVALTTGTGNAGTPGRHCVNDTTAWYFLRIVDDSDWEMRQSNGARNVSVDDFELAFALAPGYCFESRTGDSYVIGDDFDRLE